MQIAEQLLGAGAAAGADITDGDTRRTALHLAAQAGEGRLVDLLLARGVPLNAQDSSGATPLLAAVAPRAPDLTCIPMGTDPGHDNSERCCAWPGWLCLRCSCKLQHRPRASEKACFL
jgi:hypothetical protein